MPSHSKHLLSLLPGRRSKLGSAGRFLCLLLDSSCGCERAVWYLLWDDGSGWKTAQLSSTRPAQAYSRGLTGIAVSRPECRREQVGRACDFQVSSSFTFADAASATASPRAERRIRWHVYGWTDHRQSSEGVDSGSQEWGHKYSLPHFVVTYECILNMGLNDACGHCHMPGLPDQDTF